jgi:hypothetical protein
MPFKLEALKIERTEIERLIDLNFIDSLALDLAMLLIKLNFKNICLLSLNIFLTFTTVAIIVLSVALLGFRDRLIATSDRVASNSLLLIVLIIGILVVTFSWHFYLWQKAKKLKILATLLNKLEKYNDVIKSLILIEELKTAQNLNQILLSEELLPFLELVRETLIKALNLENLLRKHQQLVNNCDELFASLDDNLTTLMVFEPNDRLSEYGNLVGDALQIGMSVHREIKKLRKNY